VSLLILGFFGWRIQTEINRGIGSIKAALAEIAQGNLGIRVTLKSQDEFGEMAKSLDETAARLREIISSVKNAADQAAQSSDGMSHQVELLIERGHARNERIMAVSAAMEQITVANSEVSSLAGNAAEAVKLNQDLAHNGDANMSKNQAAMEKVVTTVNSSVNIINKLSDSIQKIGQITTVIKEIAEQTNLLALNAAIEAARAGEQGRGFAVVADEVRKLAERTSTSTNEISGVVDLIRSETSSAVGAMGEVDREVGEGANYSRLTGEALKQIVEAANKVTEMVEQIASSTKEQASATDDVAQNLEGISSVTEENAASIQQVGDTSMQVAHIAIELQKIVGQFRL
ncbi:MAG: methyl-accepting chemotaxis protein, partial [Sulfuricellaceae bacterium]|nr:methyl-accepting chemotaxis protein [Sulfuricellaceae bacterium]